MKIGSMTKLCLGVLAAVVVVFLVYRGLGEAFRDKSVVPQSSWRDSESLFPAVKWIIPGLGEMLNVYGITWLDLEESDFDILKVEGTFPSTRYFSVSVHTEDMKTETYNIKDFEIVPDKGSINPFVVGNERKKGQKYTVYLVKEGVTVDPSLKNVLVLPRHFGDKIALVTRQYRADDDTPLDQVAKPYPVVTALHQDLNPGIAPTAVGGLPNNAMDYLDFDNFENWYDKHQAFQVKNGNANSIDFLAYRGDALGPSKDNRYLAATLGDDFSKVAVIGIPSPPTYENTRLGGPLVGGKNMRYWSFCHAEGRMGMVNDCINDDRMKANRDGSVTLVVGPESVKEAVEAAGLNYMSWTRDRTIYKPLMRIMFSGNQTYDPERNEKKSLVIFRQVLTDPDWDGAVVSHVDKYFELFDGKKPFEPTLDDRAEVLLGESAPRGFVLDVGTFLQGMEHGDFSRGFSSSYPPTD